MAIRKGGPRIVGLDLSIVSTGVCLPSGQTVTIRPDGVLDTRLVYARRALNYYFQAVRPDIAVIEEVPPSLRGGTITIVRLSLIHGVARELLASLSIPFVYVTASQLKKYATGSGSAEKSAMIEAAIAGGAQPANSDEADAYWCWAVGRQQYDMLGAADGRTRTLASFQALKWPDLR